VDAKKEEAISGAAAHCFFFWENKKKITHSAAVYMGLSTLTVAGAASPELSFSFVYLGFQFCVIKE